MQLLRHKENLRLCKHHSLIFSGVISFPNAFAVIINLPIDIPGLVIFI